MQHPSLCLECDSLALKQVSRVFPRPERVPTWGSASAWINVGVLCRHPLKPTWALLWVTPNFLSLQACELLLICISGHDRPFAECGCIPDDWISCFTSILDSCQYQGDFLQLKIPALFSNRLKSYSQNDSSCIRLISLYAVELFNAIKWCSHYCTSVLFTRSCVFEISLVAVH